MAKSYVNSLLGENERILYTGRQHWLVLLSSITVEIIVVLILIALAIVAGIFFPAIFMPLGLIAAIVLLVVPFIGGLHDALVWWNQQYIITNWRVMHVNGVFNKQVTDSSLEKVNDVKLEQTALGRILNYGDIQILTAAEMGVDQFKRIGEPIPFKIAMINAKDAFERGMRTETPNDYDLDDIPAMIERLDLLRKSGVISETEFQEKKNNLLAKL